MAVRARTRRTWREEDGVTAILGGILMLALLMTLVPGAVMLKQAMSDEMAAQREAAERAAFCARHPNSKVMDCKGVGPLPGYRCEEAAPDVFLCGPEELPLDYKVVPLPATSVPPTPLPSPPTPVPSVPAAVPAPVPTPACDVQGPLACVPQGHVLV